ncbi:unnamed protein product, partial [Cyprideis torosa]
PVRAENRPLLPVRTLSAPPHCLGCILSSPRTGPSSASTGTTSMGAVTTSTPIPSPSTPGSRMPPPGSRPQDWHAPTYQLCRRKRKRSLSLAILLIRSDKDTAIGRNQM